MWMPPETAAPAKNRANKTAGRKPLIEDARVFGVFDKLRVTSLSGMGNAVLASLILLIAERELHGHNSMSRFQAGEHQASSVHESRLRRD
jgi:hypothetical protein